MNDPEGKGTRHGCPTEIKFPKIASQQRARTIPLTAANPKRMAPTVGASKAPNHTALDAVHYDDNEVCFLNEEIGPRRRRSVKLRYGQSQFIRRHRTR